MICSVISCQDAEIQIPIFILRKLQEKHLTKRTFIDDFWAQVGLHQGSVLSLCLLIIALSRGALSREIRSWFPEKLLYADELALITETLEVLNGKLETEKRALEWKEVRVDIKKIEIMISSKNAVKVTKKARFLVSFAERV